MKIIDVSLPIHEEMIVYPGNPLVRIRKNIGDASFHSEITLGSHTGTHIDAPRHVFSQGNGIDGIPLSALIGRCRVLDLTHVENAIRVEDFQKYAIKRGERILVKTKNSLRGYKEFREDFIYLSGDAADYLAARGIMLFGIDYLSIKEKGSSDTRAHTSLLQNNIVILEGLDLASAQAGAYDLICLPLKFIDLDGSPVRALLIKP